MNKKDFINITYTFKDKVFRFAKRLLISTEEAEDATQELLLKMWLQKDTLIHYKNIEAYAMASIRNYCLDRLKSKQAKLISLNDQRHEIKQEITEEKTDKKTNLIRIQKLINELPEIQKTVIQLRDIEQYDFDEISEILNMKEGTIRVNLSRARKTIRKALITQNNYEN